MRIAVRTSLATYYLNFDLIVDFSFKHNEEGNVILTYSSTTAEDSFDRIIITEEEKNRILNKLDLL